MTVDQLAVLDDRYVLNDLVASGGMAHVYRATDRVLHRQVAVKMLRDSAEGAQRHRFIDEARTLASLNHPGLVTLLDAGFQNDHPYLVMELAEGQTLAQAIGGNPLDPVEVARIGGELAAALDYAHGAGIVHRDVKPSNVLLCDDGRVLLADFGIARLVGATEHHTLPGEAIGSPAYLAPEQVSGEPLTPAVDVYSLGLVLLEALTGERAYSGPPIEAAVARLTASPEVPPHLEDFWKTLITRMTARDPITRPDAAEVAAGLVPVVGPDGASLATGPLPLPLTDEGDRTQALGPLVEPLARPRPWSALARPRRHRVSGAVLGGEATQDGLGARRERPLRGRRLLTFGLVVLAALVLLLVIVMTARSGGGSNAPAQPLPSGVPTNLQGPLHDLHDAVDGVPR
jgi:serine/threonine protein kinase